MILTERKEFDMKLHLTTGIFDGYNNRDGILLCGYEFGGSSDDDDDADETSENKRPQKENDCVISNKKPFYGEGWPWRYDSVIIKWFELWGHPLSKEKKPFEKTIAQTNWCNTQNPRMPSKYQDKWEKLLDPVQVENFLHHVRTLQPRLILFFGAELIQVLQNPKVLEPFQKIVGKLVPVDGKRSICLQKESKSRRFNVWLQNFERCKVVCLPHPTGAHVSDDYIKLFKDEIGSRIQEVKTLKGI
jgi:hypothetical protein